MTLKIIIFVFLTILSYAGVFFLRQWLEKRRILDHPNERSSHEVPTPRGGGWLIVIITLVTVLAFAIAAQKWNQSLVYVGLGTLIAWIGWLDDVSSLSTRFRFLMQGIAAALVIVFIGYFKSVTIPVFGEIQFGFLAIPITFVWIIGLTNAYNFMDGIDGISGGVAVAAGLGWMILSSTSDIFQGSTAFWVGLAIAASSLGFLGHNWPPAKIFMGDVSSTFLGFSFAVLPLFSAKVGGDALLLGTTILWTFIMDAGVTFLIRLAKREKVFSPHRTHLYQRLVISGIKPALVSSLYIALTLFASFLAFGWTRGYTFVPPLIIFGLPLIWILLSVYAACRNRES
jgi:UDP-N-acetylmuramyl pentapeptide phosphotransferase/UDP-N-acetylglucosamine-1-phosphate transferase